MAYNVIHILRIVRASTPANQSLSSGCRPHEESRSEFLPIPSPIALFGLSLISIVGLIGVAIGTFIIVLANKENTYALKGVRIHEGHKVITTEPYGVPHPLYAGLFIMALSTLIALGSLIAFIPAIA